MPKPQEPVAEGLVLTLAGAHADALAMLEREARSILKAVRAPAADAGAAEAPVDYVLLLVEPSGDVDAMPLPDLKERAAAAVAVAEEAADGRAALVRARKRLRAQGAALGPLELVFAPQDFGYLGLESDGLRERLEILLRTLAHDAERLRLKREGWEEPL